jgi:hypothetical protein
VYTVASSHCDDQFTYWLELLLGTVLRIEWLVVVGECCPATLTRARVQRLLPWEDRCGLARLTNFVYDQVQSPNNFNTSILRGSSGVDGRHPVHEDSATATAGA